MLNGLMSGKSMTDGFEGRPLIAHEVGLRVKADLENLFGLSKREIFHCQSARLPCRRADRRCLWPLDHGQHRCLRCPALPFATTPGRWGVRRSFEAAAELELVDPNRACERRFPRHHQPQSMSHSPGGRLADTQCFSQPHR
jgi:hypothetical protein